MLSYSDSVQETIIFLSHGSVGHLDRFSVRKLQVSWACLGWFRSVYLSMLLSSLP